jgi:centromere protein B
MNNKGKRKSFTVNNKINIVAEVGAHIDTRVELASCLRLSVSKLNTIVKNHEETERRYIQCGPSSKQQISLKRSPLEKLESALVAWFQQAHESNASIGDTLHITSHLGIANFLASNRWIDRFKRRHNIVYRTLSGESRSVDLGTVEDWKNYPLL